MTRWVLDASVVIKWVLPERGETDTARAEAFLAAFVDRSLALVTPDTILVTADDAYFRKARRAGRIVRLAEVTDPASSRRPTR